MKDNFEVLFHKVIAHLPEGVLIYGPDHKVLVMNPAAEKILGLPMAEVVGKTFLISDSDDGKMKFFRQVFFPSLASKISHISSPGDYPEIIDISFSDPRRELRITTIRIADGGGQATGFVKIIEDRTREATVLQSKSEFVSLVSHQLRTPLTAINWTFQLLVKESLADGQGELVRTGALATAELVSRIDDAIEVTKIEDGRFDYKFKEFDFVGLLDEAVQRTKLSAAQYEVAVNWQKPTGVHMVTADGHKLGVAVSNLLSNAVRYSKSGGTVHVSLVSEGERVKFSVTDDGIGIAEADMKNIFSKFFRAENARKVQPDGNGLGLFIAKNVIENHGGSIQVKSTLDRGSEFVVTLPTDSSQIPLFLEQQKKQA